MAAQDVPDSGSDSIEELSAMAESGVESSDVLTLQEISALAAEGGNPAETLMNVVGLIAQRFGADVCSAYLLEPDRANLVLAATVGLRPQCIGTLRMTLHEGLAGLVAEQVRPVAVEQGEESSPLQVFCEAGEEVYESFLGVPLIDRGVLQGVLVVQTVEAAHLQRRGSPHAGIGRGAGGAGGERGAHPGPLHRAGAGTAVGAGPQPVVELGSGFHQPVPRPRSHALAAAQSEPGGVAG